jgi:hypothetical protein
VIDPLFIEAWRHAEHRILGRTLHPLCALDILALEIERSPLLRNGAMLTPQDLILAVWILSTPPHPQCDVPVVTPDPEWAKHYLRVMLEEEGALKYGNAAIQAYFEDYWSIPEVQREISRTQSTPLGCPWMFSSVMMVCKALHYPMYDCWTMPIGKLIWHRTGLDEMESNLRVVTPESRAQAEEDLAAARSYTPAEYAALTGQKLKPKDESKEPQIVYGGVLPAPHLRLTIEKIKAGEV